MAEATGAPVVGWRSDFAVYRHMLAARVRSDWQYRTSFFAFLVAQALVTFLDFVAILLLFEAVPALGGWSVAEVAFLYGTTGVATRLADVFVGGPVEYLADRVRDGSFDLLLLRPVGALWFLSADEFALRRIGTLFQAVVVLGFAVAAIDVGWTAGRVAMVPVMIAAGTVIFTSLWVMTNSIAFWAVETRELANTVTYGGNYLTQYPLQVYSPWLRNLLAFVVPLAFVNFVPALYVLGRDAPFSLPDIARFASPLVAVVVVLVARWVWRIGIRHYQSTGT